MWWTRFRDVDDDDGSPLEISRDDLVRLVVGMQWVDACLLWQTLGAAFDALGEPGAKVTIEVDADMAAGMRPAVDIVDEWMGVR